MKGYHNSFLRLLPIGFVCCAPLIVVAQEKLFPPAEDASADYQVQVIFEGLDEPCGLVLRPTVIEEEPAQFYFAENGSGRVMRFARDSSNPQEVLRGLSTQQSNDQQSEGPWSLAFLTPTKLVVSGGVMKGGKQHIGVYLLPTNGKVLSPDQTDHTVGPLPDSGEELGLSFLATTVGETAAYFTAGGKKTPGQIFYSALEANRLDSFRPLLKGESTDWPAGICLSPLNSTGSQFLVAGYVGELEAERDSQLVFLAPKSAAELLRLTPGLYDMVGLAYSPSGLLYALDFAWNDPESGGVYRLDDALWQGRPACRAVKIASVIRPTSMVFTTEGNLLVTAFGSREQPNGGKIIEITGEF